jgi:hypothetical protein
MPSVLKVARAAHAEAERQRYADIEFALNGAFERAAVKSTSLRSCGMRE